MWLVALVVLSGAPSGLPEIPSPLGHIGGTIEPLPEGGARGEDHPVFLSEPGCEPRVAYLMRYVGGAIRAIEQLQQWLDASGQEKVLFRRKGVLAEVTRSLTDARFAAKHVCKPVPLGEGFKLELTFAPRQLCEAEGERSNGDFWFLTNDRPSAVVSIAKGAPDACLPRLSVVLFDLKGVARVRLHADWGGAISASLLGDGCKVADFSFNVERQAFVASMKSCTTKP